MKLRNNNQAMTLVEMMISLGIGISMIGMVILSSVGLFKDFASAQEYRNIHENARRSLAYISRDIRSARSLDAFATSDITLTIISVTGTTNSVRYNLYNNNLLRTETSGGSTTTNTLTDHVTTITFERWTNPGVPSTTLIDTYEIRAFLTVTNTGTFRISSDLLQTRALMRNKS